MTWLEEHNQSVDAASLAEVAMRANEVDRARELYRRAAEYEARAFEATDAAKERTRGITLVSAVSLYYKAHDFDDAETLALRNITDSNLPGFAKNQLKDLIQTVWNEKEFEQNNIGFTEGEVLVSVSGGDVVTGGAPLDLILNKVNAISGYFYRTIELLLDRPLRTRGAPERYIQEQCKPWLFQAPAGSYQFAVRVQKPMQPQLFGDDLPKIQHITDRFIEIIDAAAREDFEELVRVVPSEDYRKTFLRMTRNLAPTGKTYEKLEITPSKPGRIDRVTLSPESRAGVNTLLKSAQKEDPAANAPIHQVRLSGILRGLHLDKDWIEVTVTENDTERHIKIKDTGEVIDDLVGPMVNRRVIVDAAITQDGTYHFRDIQTDE